MKYLTIWDECTLTNPAYNWSDNEYQFIGISNLLDSEYDDFEEELVGLDIIE